MAAVWLWVRSERRRRGPAILIAVIVAVAAGTSMAALAGARRADSALDRLGAATGQPNVELVPLAEVTGRGRVDPSELTGSLDLIDEAAAIPGVEDVTHAGFWAISPDPEEECLFGLGLVRSTAPHPFGLAVAGRTTGAADEVVVNETAARELDLRVGTDLQLRSVGAAHSADWIGGDACPPADGPDISVRVTAIVRGVEEVTDSAEPGFFVGPGFHDRYAGEVAGCACVIAVRADPDRVNEVRPALEALYEPYGFTTRPVEAYTQRAAETIGLEVGTLRVAALVAAVAGILVVVQVISRQAAAVATDHQIRRALGMTRLQIAGGTALSMAPAILCGALVAVIGACLASSSLPRGLASQAEPDPGIRLDAAVLAAGFLSTVLVASAAAAALGWTVTLPVRHHTPRRVRGAIRLFPPHVALGLRMAANPGGDGARAATWSGVLGIALAVTGGLAVWTVVTSADNLRHSPTLFGVSADLAADTEVDDPDAAARAAVDAALADPDIEAVASVLRLSTETSEASGPSGTTAAVEPEGIHYERGLVGPTIQEGRPAASGDEVVLGRATAAALGAQLGDRVTVTRTDDGLLAYAVVGIAVSYGTDVVDQGFHVTDSGIHRLAVPCRTTTGTGADEAPSCAEAEVETVLARTRPDADRGAVADRLADTEMAPIPAPSIVDRFREMGPVPWYLAAMLAVLGAAGLMHSSLVTGRRRARELAIARALGFTPAQAAAAVRWQGLATAAAGLVIGLVAGVVVGRIVWRSLAESIGVVVEFRLPAWVLLLAVGWMLVVALVATAWPSVQARRARPAELLRAE